MNTFILIMMGYAINPNAPMVEAQVRHKMFVAGVQAVAQGHREGFVYGGLKYDFNLGGGWRVTPLVAAGMYHEEKRRKYWRFDKGDQWDKRYMLQLEVTKAVTENLRAGVYWHHVTNLKNDNSARAWVHHMNDLGGAGAVLGFTFQWGV